MKKIAFCLVLLGLSAVTFVGCSDSATKPATKTTTGAPDKKPDVTTPPTKETKPETPPAPSTEPPADEAKS